MYSSLQAFSTESSSLGVHEGAPESTYTRFIRWFWLGFAKWDPPAATRATELAHFRRPVPFFEPDYSMGRVSYHYRYGVPVSTCAPHWAIPVCSSRLAC
jgi:hypothetical protein